MFTFPHRGTNYSPSLIIVFVFLLANSDKKKSWLKVKVGWPALDLSSVFFNYSSVYQCIYKHIMHQTKVEWGNDVANVKLRLC